MIKFCLFTKNAIQFYYFSYRAIEEVSCNTETVFPLSEQAFRRQMVAREKGKKKTFFLPPAFVTFCNISQTTCDNAAKSRVDFPLPNSLLLLKNFLLSRTTAHQPEVGRFWLNVSCQATWAKIRPKLISFKKVCEAFQDVRWKTSSLWSIWMCCNNGSSTIRAKEFD